MLSILINRKTNHIRSKRNIKCLKNLIVNMNSNKAIMKLRINRH